MPKCKHHFQRLPLEFRVSLFAENIPRIVDVGGSSSNGKAGGSKSFQDKWGKCSPAFLTSPNFRRFLSHSCSQFSYDKKDPFSSSYHPKQALQSRMLKTTKSPLSLSLRSRTQQSFSIVPVFVRVRLKRKSLWEGSSNRSRALIFLTGSQFVPVTKYIRVRVRPETVCVCV